MKEVIDGTSSAATCGGGEKNPNGTPKEYAQRKQGRLCVKQKRNELRTRTAEADGNVSEKG